MNPESQAPDWIPFLDAASSAFRLGMDAAGSEHLTRFIDVLPPVLRSKPPETIRQFGMILNESLKAQSRQDFSYLADQLEYRIKPLLGMAETGSQLCNSEGNFDAPGK